MIKTWFPELVLSTVEKNWASCALKVCGLVASWTCIGSGSIGKAYSTCLGAIRNSSTLSGFNATTFVDYYQRKKE